MESFVMTLRALRAILTLRALRAILYVSGLGVCTGLPSFSEAFAEAFDGGGRVGDYLSLVDSVNQGDGKIEISGICASACTLKLGARNVCVRADAQLWFHAARNENGQINRLANLLMMDEYPRRIRLWVSGSGALTTLAFTTLSGARAIAMGVPDCDRGVGRSPSRPDPGRRDVWAAPNAGLSPAGWRSDNPSLRGAHGLVR